MGIKVKNAIIIKDEIKLDFKLSLIIIFIMTEKITIIGSIMEKTKIKFERVIALKFWLYRMMMKNIPNRMGVIIKNFGENILLLDQNFTNIYYLYPQIIII